MKNVTHAKPIKLRNGILDLFANLATVNSIEFQISKSTNKEMNSITRRIKIKSRKGKKITITNTESLA